MCNYNGRIVSKAEFIRLKNLEKQLDALQFGGKSVSGFDYSEWPVIKPIMDGADWKFASMEWGFVPDTWYRKPLDTREKVARWRNGYKDPVKGWIPGITTLNAKAEELFVEGKIYAESAMERRIILPSPGFYEARHINKIGKVGKLKGMPLKGTENYPYRIHPKGQSLFLMAAIWKPWKDAETGETVETFSIVTTEANPLMKQIHNLKGRQPTMLTTELAEEWLFGDLDEERISEIARYQAPVEAMDYYTIQRKFWTLPNPDDKYEYEELAEIVL